MAEVEYVKTTVDGDMDVMVDGRHCASYEAEVSYLVTYGRMWQRTRRFPTEEALRGWVEAHADELYEDEAE